MTGTLLRHSWCRRFPRAWNLISAPVSEENEARVCRSMLEGCQGALDAYPTTVRDDETLANSAPANSREGIAIRARLGEKRALLQAASYFAVSASLKPPLSSSVLSNKSRLLGLS